MPIGVGQIVGIALRIVSKRDKIAELWGQIVPLVEDIRGGNPGKISKLLDELIPEGELEEGKQQPQEYTVEWLQESLNALGANPELTVDGTYGEATMDAVMDYQTAHPPLVPDGWAGVQTQASIVEELAKL